MPLRDVLHPYDGENEHYPVGEHSQKVDAVPRVAEVRQVALRQALLLLNRKLKGMALHAEPRADPRRAEAGGCSFARVHGGCWGIHVGLGLRFDDLRRLVDGGVGAEPRVDARRRACERAFEGLNIGEPRLGVEDETGDDDTGEYLKATRD